MKQSESKSPVEGWTDGRYRAFIISTLRGGMRRFPNKWEALKNAYIGKQKNVKSGKMAAHYRCAHCGGAFPSSMVEVDHTSPVVDSGGWRSWDDYIARLYCSVKELQVLCKEDHKIKTQQEKSKRIGKKLPSSTPAKPLRTTSKGASGVRSATKRLTTKRKKSSRT